MTARTPPTAEDVRVLNDIRRLIAMQPPDVQQRIGRYVAEIRAVYAVDPEGMASAVALIGAELAAQP